MKYFGAVSLPDASATGDLDLFVIEERSTQDVLDQEASDIEELVEDFLGHNIYVCNGLYYIDDLVASHRIDGVRDAVLELYDV